MWWPKPHRRPTLAHWLPADLLRVLDARAGVALPPIRSEIFGASRFDPRSDKWVRISMFQDMPYPDEMAGRNR